MAPLGHVAVYIEEPKKIGPLPTNGPEPFLRGFDPPAIGIQILNSVTEKTIGDGPAASGVLPFQHGWQSKTGPSQIVFRQQQAGPDRFHWRIDAACRIKVRFLFAQPSTKTHSRKQINPIHRAVHRRRHGKRRFQICPKLLELSDGNLRRTDFKRVVNQ